MYMKKLHLILMLLVLASAGLFGLLNPTGAQAAENGQAGKYRLVTSSGPGAGQVTVSWNDVATVDNYHIVYGTGPSKMEYGALNIGKVNKYTVKGLVPGSTYYFAVVPVFGNQALFTTKSVKGMAMGGKVMVAKTSQQVIKTQASSDKQAAMKVVGKGPVGKHNLRATAGTKVGEVVLSWDDAVAVDNYHLVYGTSSSKMEYGALNIGTDNKYTVKSLAPGVKYYFALVPVFNNQALYTTKMVASYARGSTVEVVQSTPEAVRQPKAITQPKPVVKEANPDLSVSQAPVATSAPEAQPTTPAGI